VFAYRQRLGDVVTGYAHAIKIHALAKLGELLAVMPKNVGAKGSVVSGAGRVPVKDTTATYADLGLSKKTAAVAQQLATLPLSTRDAIAQQETSISEALREKKRATTKAMDLPAGRFRCGGKYRWLRGGFAPRPLGHEPRETRDRLNVSRLCQPALPAPAQERGRSTRSGQPESPDSQLRA